MGSSVGGAGGDMSIGTYCEASAAIVARRGTCETVVAVVDVKAMEG